MTRSNGRQSPTPFKTPCLQYSPPRSSSHPGTKAQLSLPWDFLWLIGTLRHFAPLRYRSAQPHSTRPPNVAGGIRQQGEKASSLYGLRQASLMLSTGSCPGSRIDLTTNRDILGQHRSIFIIYLYPPSAKGTNRRSDNEFFSPSCSREPIPAPWCFSGFTQVLSPCSCSNGRSSGSISPSSDGRAVRLSRKTTRFATTSRLVRICPSCPSQPRACNLPST